MIILVSFVPQVSHVKIVSLFNLLLVIVSRVRPEEKDFPGNISWVAQCLV